MESKLFRPPPKMSEEAVCFEMLKAGVVDIRDVDGGQEPFRYSSGNFGPGYVMAKGLVGRQDIFKPLVQQLALRLVEDETEFDNIAGNATGGMIPAYQCREDYQNLSGQDVGFVYIRSAKKEGGQQELVTGLEHIPARNQAGQAASWLVVEELVNFGETTTKSIQILRGLGFVALEAATLLHYGHDQVDAKLAENEINLTCLTTLPKLLDVAVSDRYYSAEAVASYREFLADPSQWQSARGITPIKE